MARGRKKKAENVVLPKPPDLEVEAVEPIDDSFLPNKHLFRVAEAAFYLGGYSESTIRTWIAHGILEAEKHNREFRITRETILEFRAKSKFRPLEDAI